MEERLVTGDFQPEDSAVETTLRPHTLREYVGQQAVKDSLSIYIQAALTRHDALDHIIVKNAPGAAIRCYKRLNDAWFDCISDHYPLYADVEI